MTTKVLQIKPTCNPQKKLAETLTDLAKHKVCFKKKLENLCMRINRYYLYINGQLSLAQFFFQESHIFPYNPYVVFCN